MNPFIAQVNTKKRRHIPHIPENYLEDLLSAIQTAHSELLQPPSRLDDEAKDRWVKECHSRLKPEISWDAMKSPEKAAAAFARAEADRLALDHGEKGKDAGGDVLKKTDSLTIGLIGESLFTSITMQRAFPESTGNRTTKLRKILAVECSSRTGQSESIKDTREGR